MIDAKRLDAIKRRAMVGDPVVGVGDTITNGELFELIQSRAIALKELRVIYDRHDVSQATEDMCHAIALELMLEEVEQQPTASDHLKQATGSLGGDRLQRFDARLVHDACGNPDVLMKETHDGLFVRYEDAAAALAQKTRECEELFEDAKAYSDAAKMWRETAESLKAQVEQLGRQVAEMSKPVTGI